jgi:hypothetical protein
MEPESSSPHSQAHATYPYPEPDQSSPHTHIPLPEGPSYYYPPIYAWVSSAVLSYMEANAVCHVSLMKEHTAINDHGDAANPARTARILS